MICPKCKKEFTTPPALSRRDNNEICSLCGSKEAIEDALKAGMIDKDGAEAIIKELENDFEKHNK